MKVASIQDCKSRTRNVQTLLLIAWNAERDFSIGLSAQLEAAVLIAKKGQTAWRPRNPPLSNQLGFLQPGQSSSDWTTALIVSLRTANVEDNVAGRQVRERHILDEDAEIISAIEGDVDTVFHVV